MHHELKPSVLARLQGVSDGSHVREGIALGYAIYNVHVFLVLNVVLRGGQPLVGREVCSRLDHLVNLLVQLEQRGRVAGRLDAVAAVERVLREGHLQEGALHNAREVVQLLLLALLVATLHLVLIDGDADHVRARRLDDGAHGPAHATPRIQHLHPGLHLYALGDLHLVADDGRVKALALVARCKVERLAPAVFVKVRDQAVKVVYKLGGVQLARPDTLAVILGEELLVPVNHVLHVLSREGARVSNLEKVGAEACVAPHHLVQHVRACQHRGGGTAVDGVLVIHDLGEQTHSEDYPASGATAAQVARIEIHHRVGCDVWSI
mmetsp:Transcript_12341/g.23407  ORF Transcript_12341/g.23407 Transcript_12341/m.23407 type:complete len:322 (+) Transcript_12341:774-1739(+)